MERKPKRKRSSTKRNHHTWTTEELDETRAIFKGFILKGVTPRQGEVEKAMRLSQKRNGFIHKLKRDNIKKKVNWIIQSNKGEETL